MASHPLVGSLRPSAQVRELSFLLGWIRVTPVQEKSTVALDGDLPPIPPRPKNGPKNRALALDLWGVPAKKLVEPLRRRGGDLALSPNPPSIRELEVSTP